MHNASRGGNVRNVILFTSHSASAYFWLLGWTLVCVAFVSGWFSIIRKSGYSPWWTVLPATPTALTLLVLYLAFFDVGAQVVTVGQWSALVNAIGLTDLANFIAFLVFASVTWPIEREVWSLNSRLREARGAALLQTANVQLHPNQPSMSSTRVPPPGGGRPGFGPATAVLAAPAPLKVTESTSSFCSWCGIEREADAFSIHHCGARTRPPAFCSSCGHALGSGVPFCEQCATPASRLSPH
jgi:hypothetical protein